MQHQTASDSVISRRSSWSREEQDETLRHGFQSYGQDTWHHSVATPAVAEKSRDGKTASVTGRVRWSVCPGPHIVHTHQQPLSDFEEALLLQAQCLHGNKWTFIAAQYLPWRFPLDLRSACHVKTKQERAARNPHLREGQSLAWLLSHTPSEYKQRWEQHKRRVSTSQTDNQVRSTSSSPNLLQETFMAPISSNSAGSGGPLLMASPHAPTTQHQAASRAAATAAALGASPPSIPAAAAAPAAAAGGVRRRTGSKSPATLQTGSGSMAGGDAAYLAAFAASPRAAAAIASAAVAASGIAAAAAGPAGSHTLTGSFSSSSNINLQCPAVRHDSAAQTAGGDICPMPAWHYTPAWQGLTDTPAALGGISTTQPPLLQAHSAGTLPTSSAAAESAPDSILAAAAAAAAPTAQQQQQPLQACSAAPAGGPEHTLGRKRPVGLLRDNSGAGSPAQSFDGTVLDPSMFQRAAAAAGAAAAAAACQAGDPFSFLDALPARKVPKWAAAAAEAAATAAVASRAAADGAAQAAATATGLRASDVALDAHRAGLPMVLPGSSSGSSSIYLAQQPAAPTLTQMGHLAAAGAVTPPGLAASYLPSYSSPVQGVAGAGSVPTPLVTCLSNSSSNSNNSTGGQQSLKKTAAGLEPLPSLQEFSPGSVTGSSSGPPLGLSQSSAQQQRRCLTGNHSGAHVGAGEGPAAPPAASTWQQQQQQSSLPCGAHHKEQQQASFYAALLDLLLQEGSGPDILQQHLQQQQQSAIPLFSVTAAVASAAAESTPPSQPSAAPSMPDGLLQVSAGVEEACLPPAAAICSTAICAGAQGRAWLKVPAAAAGDGAAGPAAAAAAADGAAGPAAGADVVGVSAAKSADAAQKADLGDLQPADYASDLFMSVLDGTAAAAWPELGNGDSLIDLEMPVDADESGLGFEFDLDIAQWF